MLPKVWGADHVGFSIEVSFNALAYLVESWVVPVLWGSPPCATLLWGGGKSGLQ